MKNKHELNVGIGTTVTHVIVAIELLLSLPSECAIFDPTKIYVAGKREKRTTEKEDNEKNCP